MPKNTFNIEPYFDDFDESKNFHQVLFKPKFPIQTREMNQQQSIVYNQIERFGNHIFKHGSIVADTVPSYDNNISYARLKDLDTTEDNLPVNVSLILNKKLVGKTTGITATCILVAELTDNDPNTIYINYLTSSSTDTGLSEDGESDVGLHKVFLDGEELIVYDDNNNSVYSVAVRCPTCQGSVEPITELTSPTGKASIFSVSEGIYYIFGRFVYTDDQIIIIDKYDTIPNVDVGFTIIQTIVTEHDDLSLLDNSLGYPNYTSPGADRYKISLSLEKTMVGSEAQDNWVKLATIEYGILKDIKSKPEYADIMDMLARRTYDESGDYTVKPFLISFKNFVKSSEDSNDGIWYPNDGTLQSEIDEYNDKFVANMTGGKAYVKGYEIDRVSDFNLVMDRARDSGTIENNALRYTQGNYIYVAITPTSNTYPLYDTTENHFAVDFEDVGFYTDSNIWQTGAPLSVAIGTAKVKSQLFTGKTIRDYANAVDVPVFQLFLFDMVMDDGVTFNAIDAVYKSGMDTFSAKVLTDNEFTEIDAGLGNGSGLNEAQIYEPTSNSMITRLGESFTNGVENVTLTTRKKFYGSCTGTDFNFSMSPTDVVEAFNPLKWIFSVEDGNGNYLYHEVLPEQVVITGDSKQVTVSGFPTNANACVILDVISFNVSSKIKTLATSSITLTYTVGNIADPIPLDIVDGFRISSVIDITDVNNTFDVTSDFTMNSGVTDNTYELASIQRTQVSAPIYDGTGNAVYEIVYEYFIHNNTTHGYFFSANSYQSMIDDPNQDFDYEDIPTYVSQDEQIYELRSCLDFRVDADPNEVNGEFSDTTFIPSNQSNIIHDILFYLPRVDKIVIDGKTSTFNVVKGVPSMKPIAPKTPKGTMELYTVHLEPYTLDIKKDVLTKYKNNRRYTMRDIGKLETRLDNLEYYVTFNMLERDASEASIKDANGIDRYKNGFITDNFESFKASDTTHPEFNGAIDISKSEGRPSFHTRKIDIDLDTGSSSNYQITGNMATNPYRSLVMLSQNLSSKTVSVNPYFIFNWEGKVRLIPEYDSWKDVERQPDLIVGIDTGMDDGKEFDGGQINGVLFGNWEATNTNLSDEDLDDLMSLDASEDFSDTGTFKSISSSGTSIVNGNLTNTLTVVKTNDVVEQKSLGDRVTDVNLIPFVREQDIQFVATAMRPNTVIYPFFDGVDVSQYCRPLNGANGDTLATTSKGQFLGVFSLPNTDVINFHTGDRVFKLTDSSVNSSDVDEVTTSAVTKFWSGGLQTTVQETIQEITREVETINTINVNVSQCTYLGQLYTEGTQNPIRQTCRNGAWVNPPPPRPNPDPVAQSFYVSEEHGCFATQLSIYFSAKSASDSVWVELREMTNGYPAPTVLMYSQCTKEPANVVITDDASLATTFTFESLVYMSGGKEYCFVVGSKDLAYRVHVAKMGGISTDGSMITTQPNLGSLFKSQNNTTWNAEQTEDIKFNLWKAEFNRNDMTLNFKDSGFDVDQLEFNPIETENLSDLVRIHHRNHGFTVGDKLSMDLFTKNEFDIIIKTGDLIIGQQLSISTGICTVTSSSFVEDMITPAGVSAKRYKCNVKDIVGYFNGGENNIFTANQYIEEIADSFILGKYDIDEDSISNQQNLLTSCVGYFEDDLNGNVNGIPFDAFTDPVQPHTVLTVDSMDSYTIQTSGFPANLTAFGGGSGVTVGSHIQLDMFSLQGNIKKYDCSFVNTLVGVTHAGINTNFSNYQTSSLIYFQDNENQYLEQPLKIANELNVGSTPSGTSLDIDLVSTLITGDVNVSPVVMLPTISFTSITNRVDWNDYANYEVAPNEDTIEPLNQRWVDETDPLDGVESAKYVLKKVSLENPATTLKIYLDVFKPNESAVDVYYKILPVEKSSGLENENWVLAPYDIEFVSSSANDFIESEITLGDPDYGQTPLTDFKEFRIKVVMRTKNSALPPKIKNLRAIAVT